MAARQLHKLSKRDIARLKTKPGRHSDGGNLYLEVTPQLSASWSFISAMTGQRGFGSDLSPDGTRRARERAAEWRAYLARGEDPREAERAAVAKRKSFGECADGLLAAKRSELVDCAPIRDLPVDEVNTAAVLSILQPAWQATPVTAQRIRGRIEAVLNFAKAHGYRSGENCAAWRGHLALILLKRQRLEVRHHAAIDYCEIPEFLRRLSQRKTMTALALRFLIATAGRLSEVTGARWEEIDQANRVWIVPGPRMKAGRQHIVPLSNVALAVIEEAAAIQTTGLVFPSRGGRQLSAWSLNDYCAPATTHGMRASFRTWSAEQTVFPRELAEQCLAHVVYGPTEAAYMRSDMLEKRRLLMQSWADFCCPESDPKVVSIARGSRK